MTSENGNKSKVIKGIQNLADFYGISRPTIYRYMKMPYPLPGIKIDGQWLFHVENVDNWFKKITLQKPDLSDEDLSEINP